MIQSFNRIVVSFFLMIKIIKWPYLLAFRWNNGNGVVVWFNNNGKKLAKKPGKLSKLEKLKSEKLFKLRKLAKSKKKLSISANLFKFDAKKTKPSFLTLDAKTIFN